jgi:hypothetical protein
MRSAVPSAPVTAKAVYHALGVGCISLIFCIPALAQQFTVCLGDSKSNCPPPFDVWFSCGTKVDQAAQSLCTSYTAATQQLHQYRIVTRLSKDGGMCGYSVFSVTCLPR